MTESKQNPQSEIAARVSLEEYDALWKEITALKKENLELTMKKRKKQLKEANISTPEPVTVSTPEPEVKSTPESPTKHFLKPYDKVCSDCGEPNKDFKDETMCDPSKGGCGKHLGALEFAQKLVACPECGGKSLKLTAEGEKAVAK